MKLLLITVGSRGDVEPYIALSSCLMDRNHQVDLFIQTDALYLADHLKQKDEKNLLKVHEMPFTQMDFYKFVGNPSKGGDSDNPRVRFIGALTDLISELVFPCAPTVLQTAMECGTEMIVTSSIARPLCIPISQKLDIPICLVQLQALAPNPLFPHYSHVDDCVSSIVKYLNKENEETDSLTQEEKEKNLNTYVVLEKCQYDFTQDRLVERVYEKLLDGLKPYEFDDILSYLKGTHKNAIIANAFSSIIHPNICTSSEKKGAKIYDVGALADSYIPHDWSPTDELSQFLGVHSTSTDSTTKPICIGYGSMPFDKISLIIDILIDLNRKAILVGSAFADISSKTDDEEKKQWIETNIFQVNSIPYAWLLPHCSMLVCHGGAGTVHVALRAGIPVVISPLLGDQFFFAKLLQKLKIGYQASQTLGAVSKEDITKAIQMVSTQEFIGNASKTGESIRSYYQQTGPDLLINILEKAI